MGTYLAPADVKLGRILALSEGALKLEVGGVHSSGSMTWMTLRSPEIALVGQRLVQAVQPMQVSTIL
jgi:hypothetical protein